MHKRRLILPLLFAGTLFGGWLYSQTLTPDPSPLRILQISIAESSELEQVQTSLDSFQKTGKLELPMPIATELVTVKNQDEYMIKRNTIMLRDHAPDLIVAGSLPLEDLGELGLLLPLEGKLKNGSQLRAAFKTKYTVTAGYHLKSVIINKNILDSLNLPVPSPDWTDEDVIQLIRRIKSEREGVPIYLTKELYEVYFNAYLGNFLEDALAKDINAFNLKDPAFTTALISMKKELNGLYDLSEVPSHSSRQRMIFDSSSQEYAQYLNQVSKSLYDGFVVLPTVNAMNTPQLSRIYEENSNVVLLPIGKEIYTLRFGISASTKNPEQALAFLDSVIGWRSQYSYSIYSKAIKYAQVNEENESRLSAYGDFFAKDTNVTEIRQKVLAQMERGYYKDAGEIPKVKRILRDELMLTSFNIIFDPHLDTDAKILKELGITQDRIKLMVKE